MEKISYIKPELEEADFGKFVAGASVNQDDANIPDPV